MSISQHLISRIRTFESKIFLPLKIKSLFYNYYLFYDTKEYHADNLFVHSDIHIYFLNEWTYPSTKYVLVLCKVKKKYTKTFIECMEQLKNKMLLLGYYDYIECCEKLNATFDDKKWISYEEAYCFGDNSNLVKE